MKICFAFISFYFFTLPNFQKSKSQAVRVCAILHLAAGVNHYVLGRGL
jgi:hypothetical protein